MNDSSIRDVLDNLHNSLTVPEDNQLPQPVIDFQNNLQTETETTIQRLRSRACALRERANELDKKADDLENLIPDVIGNIEYLVRFERASARVCSSLSEVNPEEQPPRRLPNQT